jgi:UDP-N-acetylglucosamine 2-epimerase (non-hydrolysing)
MIGAVIGTTGELIKMAPVLLALQERGTPAAIIATAQQVKQLPPFLEDFGLPQPSLYLARGFRGEDLEHSWQVPVWAATVAANALRSRRPLGEQIDAVMVHGDTMTTVLGSLLARLLRVPALHVEAGMRSGDWRNPFPEELNRRMAAKLVQVHFAPGERPVANLRRERTPGRIVDTGQNTIRDAVDLAAAAGAPAGMAVPAEPFGLVSLHRFELIEKPDLLAPVLEILHEHARRQPLLFVDHSVTAAAISRHGFERFFDDRFVRIPRLRYFPFISLLQASEFLVTDSGGCQEECAFLGHPALIHRAVSEHDTGLDTCVVLSKMDLGVLRGFLADPGRHRVPAPAAEATPTEIIMGELEAMSLIEAREPSRA